MRIACTMIFSALVILWAACTHEPQAVPTGPADTVLVFSGTQGYRHTSIAQGRTALERIGVEQGWKVDFTEDPWAFTDAHLKQYGVVVFLNTTGDVLTDGEQTAFERYIRGGGGFVGIHSAADTEHGWPWYNGLVGAWFDNHPASQDALFRVVDKGHPAVSFMPDSLRRMEEIYNFRSFRKDLVKVLVTVDEQSYTGGTMGADHPIAWCHLYDGGKAFYTGWGHSPEAFVEPLFLHHLAGAIAWALD